MRRRPRPLILSAVAAALCWAPTVRGEEIPPEPVDGKITWIYGYEKGKALAKETGRPMFVVFRCER